MFHAAAPRLRCDRQTALRRGEIRLQGGDGRLRRRDPAPGTIGQCKILIEPEALLPQERLNPGDLGTHPSLILNYRRFGRFWLRLLGLVVVPARLRVVAEPVHPALVVRVLLYRLRLGRPVADLSQVLVVLLARPSHSVLRGAVAINPP